MVMPRVSGVSGNGRSECSVIPITLELREPLLVAYFEPLAEPERHTPYGPYIRRHFITLHSVSARDCLE